MLSYYDITQTITVNVAAGTIVALFTSWYIWKRREKLRLSYSVTESELFPFKDGQGKYYAVKLSNNGKKLIKSISTDIYLSHAEIDQVTSHDLIKDLQIEKDQIKFSLETLNPDEDVSFIITAKVSAATTKEIKVRGEGVNASEENQSPSKFDLTATAIIFSVIGFLFTIVYANVTAEDSPKDTRLNNIYNAFAKAGTPITFHEMIHYNSDPTYRSTAYNLCYKYVTDQKHKESYRKTLENLLDYEMVKESKATILYFLYKICLQEKNQSLGNTYLNKCEDCDPATYKFYMANDQNFRLDSTIVN